MAGGTNNYCSEHLQFRKAKKGAFRKVQNKLAIITLGYASFALPTDMGYLPCQFKVAVP